MRTALVVCAALWVMLICSFHMLTAAADPPETCMDADTRERARGLMHEGLDAALRDQAKRMFEGWMKDATDQPQRAATGMKNGTRAYAGAHDAVERWNPPTCKGDRQ